MANEQNLVRGSEAHKLTAEEQSRGGIASGKARREKKKLRESLEALLSQTQVTESGKEVTGADAISIKLFEQALKGNVRAFKTIRDTVGEKPVERVQVAEIDPTIEKEMEGLLDEARRSRRDSDD